VVSAVKHGEAQGSDLTRPKETLGTLGVVQHFGFVNSYMRYLFLNVFVIAPCITSLDFLPVFLEC
jgi:hypothetical protein